MPSPSFWFRRKTCQLWLTVFVVSATVVFLFWLEPVLAAFSIQKVMSDILMAVGGAISGVLVWLIGFLITLSGYNNFINADIVSVGWVLVRDVANMFYILVLLVIAFGTMLKLEQYTWKKMLPRLLLTAILVNFSKTIIGVIIDFSQVVMLTFVNGFAATGAGNFISMFGLEKIYKIATTGIGQQGDGCPNLDNALLVSSILAVVVLGIAMIVVGVFVAILLFRIVAIWLLIVLAPLAWMMGTIPGRGQKYYADWWNKFVNQVVVGPAVAFFLWLSLATLGGGNNNSQITAGNAIAARGTDDPKTTACVITELGNWETMGGFAVVIATLMIGLQMISELGVAGASIAGSATSMIKGAATKVAKKAAWVGGAGMLVAGGAVPGLGALAVGGIGLLAGKKIGMFAGKQAKSGASKVGEGALGVLGNVPLIGGAATRKKAEMRAKRFADARKGAENVRDFTPDEVIRESQRAAFTDDGKQMKFAAQTRVLGDKDLRKKMQTENPAAFAEMVGNYKQFGDETGQSEKANSTLKELYKENPQLHTATPPTSTSPVGKTREDNIRDDMRGQSRGDKLKLSDNALSDPVVVENLTPGDQEEIFEKGSAKQKEALGKTVLTQQIPAITPDMIKDPAAVTANLSNIEAALKGPGNFETLPKGIFSELKSIFSQLSPDLQTRIATEKKTDSSSLDAGHFVGPKGDELAAGIAKSNDADLIKEVQLKVGPEFEEALKRFTTSGLRIPAGSSLPARRDPRVLNVLETLNRDTKNLLTRILAKPESRQMIRASNSDAWLKKVDSADLIDSSNGSATAGGAVIGNNLSLAALGKIISEANKTGSSAMKDTAACLAALVKKAEADRTRQKDDGTPAPKMSKAEDKRLNGMLTGPASLGIDWEAKFNRL